MLRLSGNNHAFRHDGLVLEKNWTAFETLTDEQRNCLRAYHGTHIRVHSDDYGQLPRLGLQLQFDPDGNPQYGAPLIETENAKAEKSDASNTKNAKVKSDAKKEG